ncbi:hypothetical protein [Luteipulveratus halotolerans]|uniref:Uncharacterized protein n=1 Tax=Luteipulveratus halotolerans TaxID=1631356 RepID=A0A0L6CJY4_9MICO|nr:hypothetical protein [Luteipulveratus halotolerans]KNX38111.1 hypothetical protein VV01_14705 [Luteipulveratus halotolerans]
MLTSPTTGLPILQGTDYGDVIDDWSRSLDAGLARRTATPVQSFAQLEQRFPRNQLGEDDYRAVVHEPAQILYEWNQTGWVVTDIGLKAFTPYWYAGKDLSAAYAPGGGLTGWYQRIRSHCFFEIQHDWKSVDNKGDDYYVWQLPLETVDWKSYQLYARCQMAADESVIEMDAQLIGTKHVVVTRRDGQRFPLAAQRSALTTGAWWRLGGRFRVGRA